MFRKRYRLVQSVGVLAQCFCRIQLASDARCLTCNTCNLDISAVQPRFSCLTYIKTKHLTEQCTKPLKTAIEGLKALGQNVFLLSNSFAVLNIRDKLVKSATKLQQVAPVKDKRLKTLETEVNEIKKAISEMKETVIINTVP